MKYLPYLIAGLLLWGCASKPVEPTPTRQRDILEIYFDLPDEYFHCEAAPQIGRGERARLIEKQDPGNDYILASTDTHPMEVKAFENESGELAFVAVIVSCGPDCSCEKMEFLRPDEARGWVEARVKMSVSQMTEAYEARVAEAGHELHPRFKLPEEGTTIRVQDWATELPIYDLRWTGAAFEVVP